MGTFEYTIITYFKYMLKTKDILFSLNNGKMMYCKHMHNTEP